MLSMCLLLACSDSSQSQQPVLSINELMTTVVTPATNTLWGVEDPQTDAEWKILEDAARATIDAGLQVQKGGSGPNDNSWAAEAEWQAFAKEMTKAAQDGLLAIRGKNLDALYEANDVLYPPCEGCHLKFHPGVAQ